MSATPPVAAGPPARVFGEGGRAVFVAQVARLLIRLGSAAALARLLTPEAYGLHGMAAAVFGFLYMARDFGVVTALQQPDVTREGFTAFCRIGAIGGVGLALLGALLGIPTGWFYGERDTVPWVLAGMCSAFVFSGASAPALGVLYREQKAGLAAMLEAMAMAAGSVAAVAAAWAGWGVWALVVLTVTQELVLCGLAWHACPWRPARDTRATHSLSLLGFGANLTGYNMVVYGTRIMDQVTVGRTAGAVALGLYGRGAQIANLPAQFGLGPYSPWIIATLSRCRGVAPDYRQFFRRALNGLLHVSFASAIICIVVPELTLLFLFGPRWIAAAPVVRWLGVALAIQPWLMAPLWLLSAEGNVRRLLHWSLCGLALMLLGCAIAYRFGPGAVALAAAGATGLHAALGPLFCRGRTAVGLDEWWEATRSPLLLHGGLAGAWFAANALTPAMQPSLSRFAVLIAVTLVYYPAMLLLFPRLRAEFRHHLFWSR